MTLGPGLFARYAYPPNSLGYCGPADGRLLMDLLGDPETATAELRNVAEAFAGAWPYLQLIGSQTGRDPLDPAVVEAYWIGSQLLEGVDLGAWGNSVDDRFGRRAGWDRNSITDAVIWGGTPTHAFHVFCIYPWVGFLRSGIVDQALGVIDQCRIRWGRVTAGWEGGLLVESQPLVWDGRMLHLGQKRIESVLTPADARSPINIGDDVAMHWGYACQRLSTSQLRNLRRHHDRHLAIANRGTHGLSRALET